MQQPANQAPLGMFVPGQQAFAQSNQAMPPFPAAPPACGLYSSGCHAMQPQQQGALARQQQQPLTAGTGSAGARNPFAAMPRELRNNQLRSNLAAVAGAFSSCSGGAAGPRGASPPASSARSSMVPPQHQQCPAPAMHSTDGSPLAAAGAAAAGLASAPGMYLAASSGMEVAPLGSAGPSYSAGLQQAYSSSMPAPYSSGAYTSPLPPPMHSSYLQQQQQQQLMACQQGSMHAGFYSDPLPYLPNVSLPAMALPAGQQQQLFASQGLPASMPCSMPLMEPASMGYPAAAAAAAGGEGLSHAQLLFQKQKALQQLQAVEQMLLLRLLPDV